MDPIKDPNEITPQAPQTPAEPSQPSTPAPQPTVETPPTPQAPTETPTPQAAPIDTEAIKDQVSQSVIARIGEALGLTKQEAKAQLPTDPDELAKFVQDNAKKSVEQVLSDKEKSEREAQEAKQQAEREAQEAKQQALQEGAQRFQTLWKGQYDELSATRGLPKIVDPSDKNDAGVIAKTKILTKLAQILDENAKNGIEYVPTLKEVFYENPDILNTQTTAGNTVPISGGGRAMGTGQAMPYDQLHSASVEDLVKAKYGN